VTHHDVDRIFSPTGGRSVRWGGVDGFEHEPPPSSTTNPSRGRRGNRVPVAVWKSRSPI